MRFDLLDNRNSRLFSSMPFALSTIAFSFNPTGACALPGALLLAPALLYRMPRSVRGITTDLLLPPVEVIPDHVPAFGFPFAKPEHDRLRWNRLAVCIQINDSAGTACGGSTLSFEPYPRA